MTGFKPRTLFYRTQPIGQLRHSHCPIDSELATEKMYNFVEKFGIFDHFTNGLSFLFIYSARV